MGDKDETKPVPAPVEQPVTEEKATPEVQTSTELIDKANEAAERMERANKTREALITREEHVRVNETLGGKAEAGQPNKEETPEEYAKKVMAGDAGDANDK